MMAGESWTLDSETVTVYEVLSNDGGWSLTFSTVTRMVTVLVRGWLASSTA